MAISAIDPKTPPTTGAGVSFGLEDMPDAADDSAAWVVEESKSVELV
jgi:hypothetical protein